MSPAEPDASPDWPAPTAPQPVDATVVLPGSKSLTNRYLVLAALASSASRLRAPLRSRDTLLMAEALRGLGAGIEDTASGSGGGGELDWVITPGPLRAAAPVDCGLAGTVMRFLPPAAALAHGSVTFDGDPQARTRPMGPILDALRTLGIPIDDGGRGALPFTLSGTGSVRGGTVRLDASDSSQFVSGLLLSGPRYDEGVTVVHEGEPIPSQPHVDMTVEALRDAGALVDDSEPSTWRVEPSQIIGLDVSVEPDLSNAAPFLAAAAVTGGSVTVPGWPQHTTQAGDGIRQVLESMGATADLGRDGLAVHGQDGLHGIDVDLHDAAELTPVVAALCALADSPSVIRGVAHIRRHETDRLAALTAELSRLGGDVAETADGLRIRPARLRGGSVRTYGDHRMVMAAAVLGLRVPDVVIEDVQTVAKTLPTFTTLWHGMLAGERPEAGLPRAAGPRR